MNLKIKPPFFISFEGGEGAGKTTLMHRLKEKLEQEGYTVLQTREPGGSFLSEKIRELVLHHEGSLQISPKAELLLFLSARAQVVEEVIAPALNAGKIVLCDRFSDSSIAYQGYARGLGMKEVERLTSFATGKVAPDLTFFLDLDPAVGIARAARLGSLDAIEKEKLEFHQKVRQGFLEIAKDHPDRVKRLDASQSADDVFAQSLKFL